MPKEAIQIKSNIFYIFLKLYLRVIAVQCVSIRTWVPFLLENLYGRVALKAHHLKLRVLWLPRSKAECGQNKFPINFSKEGERRCNAIVLYYFYTGIIMII